MYSSRTSNLVVPSPCDVSVKVRTPLKSPSGIPPLQTILWPGVNSVTLTGKARFGLAEEILTVWLSTEFQGGRHIPRIEQIAQIEREESA